MTRPSPGVPPLSLADENSALAEAGLIVASSLDIDDVYERFAEVIGRLIPFDLIVIATLGPGRNDVTIGHIAGEQVPWMSSGTVRHLNETVYDVPAFMSGGVITSAAEAVRLAAENNEENPLVSRGFNSFIDVPLLSKGELMGSLTVCTREADAYGDAHLALAQRVAAHVAGAVANAELHAAVSRQATERQTLAEASRIMGSSLDIDTVYQRFAEAIGKLVPFDLIVVATIGPGKTDVTIAHIAGADVPVMSPGTVRKWDQTVYDVPAFKSGGVITSATEAAHIAKQKGEINPLVGKGFKAFIDVPLLSQDRLIGSITVCSRHADAYNGAHLALFQRIAAQVAGAVANAKLHATVAKEASERDVLAEIGRIVSASLDFADVYEPFAEAFSRLVPFDRLNIVTIDLEAGTITNSFVTGYVLVPGLVVGDSSRIVDSASVKSLVEQGEGILMNGADQAELLASSRVERANNEAGLLSKISLPFLLGDEIVGLINIRSRDPDAYSPDHLRLAKAVAGQVAGYFSNYRLHAEVKRDAEEREVLAEIGRIVSASLNIEDVYEPLAAAFAKLVPFDRLNVARVDKQAGTITNEYVTGSVDVPELPIGATTNVDDAILARVQMEGSAGVVMNAAEMEGMEDKWVNVRTLRKAGLLSIVSVPFKLGDEIVGLVAFRSRDPEPYGSEHLRLAQLMAGQVAGFFSNSLTYRQRTEAEAALRDSEHRFRELFDEAPIGYYETDRESRITAANRTLQEMLDYPLEELVGRHAWDFVREAVASQEMFEKWFSTPEMASTGIERTFLRRGGQPIYAIVEARQILSPDGAISGLRITVQDVTELKRIETGMRETSRLASIGELAAGVAHELNNPLTCVTGFSELLLDEDDPKRIHDYLKRVNTEAQRAAKIVQGLLSFARPRELEMTEVDLRRVVDRVVELKTYDLRTANVELKIDLPKDAAVTMADEHLLTQVLLNIVTNAEQVLNELSDGRKIAIWMSHESNYFTISVSDNGRGIAPDVVNKVFDPFFTTKEAGEGTGLGLSMAYGIVRQHDGEISVESPPGGGTSFHIKIPVRLGGDGDRDQSGMHQTPARNGDGEGTGRVLAVDDEPHIGELVLAALSRQGYRVDIARNSQEALILTQDSSYDCIVVDLKMPGMSGEDLFGILSRDRPDLAQRVVFMTGDSVSQRTNDFLVASGQPWVSKPVQLQELISEVGMVCEMAGAPTPKT